MPNVRKTLRLLRAASQKPWSVVAYRARQEAHLQWLRFAQGWPRLEHRTKQWWSVARVEQRAARLQAQPVLLASDGAAAAQTLADQHPGWKASHLDLGQRVRDKKFSVLHTAVPNTPTFPWHTDWRYDHRWDKRYFRSYDYYEPHRAAPYDVKLPWELSRLAFLQPLAQAAVLQPEGSWHDGITATLADWEAQNPLAHSIGWYAMEAAIRSVNLVLTLELLLASAQPPPQAIQTILRQLAMHGEFIERTLEYTDVRGNHYAAEIVALLLIGLCLGADYPSTARWITYASKALETEILLQYPADGVQFEKSIAYHRLVTELFMLGWIACDRASIVLSEDTQERLHAACRYTAATRRPDGQSPNVGDNDSGHVLGLDPLPLRDHQPLQDIACVRFADPGLKLSSLPTAAMAWLCGSEGLRIHKGLACEANELTNYFADSGVVIAKSERHFLWMDAGEVGMLGRGGHGHNDLLSFELALAGTPVFVDPGCSVYTGDPKLRNQFRSTSSHNMLRVDGTEIAPLQGMWNIGNDALPRDVQVRTLGSTTTIAAGHGGYERLTDPVAHHRQIEFDRHRGDFRCRDTVRCQGEHVIERFFQVAPSIQIQLAADSASISVAGGNWRMQWDKDSTASLENGWHSGGYGHCEKTQVLVLKTRICGTTHLHVELYQVTGTE